jgi:hypothetical protein
MGHRRAVTRLILIHVLRCTIDTQKVIFIVARHLNLVALNYMLIGNSFAMIFSFIRPGKA